jgi:hypothetical protein
MEVSGQPGDLTALTLGKEFSVGGWLVPCQESNPGRPTRNLVTIRTELPRLLSTHHLSAKSEVAQFGLFAEVSNCTTYFCCRKLLA